MLFPTLTPRRRPFREAPEEPRAEARRHAWEQVLADAGAAPIFVRLADPDVAAAAGTLTTRFSALPA